MYSNIEYMHIHHMCDPCFDNLTQIEKTLVNLRITLMPLLFIFYDSSYFFNAHPLGFQKHRSFSKIIGSENIQIWDMSKNTNLIH